ncbi:hypothetical protein GALL_470910 [mine drainage metagenome]|uniref:Uncharacterized protein n=1 Tax=mine drainage metagenome TaxID=410659 RepID=A0A1J5PKG3_9ZZZZ
MGEYTNSGTVNNRHTQNRLRMSRAMARASMPAP